MARTHLKLKGLSLDRLETLSAIVSNGSIARAAGGDANRQSQFSRQVAELETWFGVELLDRSASPNKPTEAALQIAREVENFMRNMDSVRENAGSGRRTVVFGAGERMIRSYLIPWAAKIKKDDLRLIFRNLTSTATRAELLAKRIDFGILRRENCPTGLVTVAMKAIPMCLLLPTSEAKSRSVWTLQDLIGFPLVLAEGEGRFNRFLYEKALDALVEIDAMVQCSTWTQVIDAMRELNVGGFLPKDLEKQFPKGFENVRFPQLSEYSDEYVIAWSSSEAEKRPEIARLAKRLRGK